MAFSDYETSRASGQPVNLFLFVYGGGSEDFYAYTDCEMPIELDDATYGSVNYQPIPIDRGKITLSSGLDKTTQTVTTPQDTDIAKLYLVYPPSYVTQLIIRQGHANDPTKDFKVCWAGRVTGCTRKGSQAQFTCEPITTSLRRNGLRRRWQFGCPHDLYGEACGASKAAATFSSTVVAVDGTRFTLPSGWYGGDPSKFLGGMVEWTIAGGTIERRTIRRVENAGTQFLISGAPRGLAAGHAVSMILGCNHKSGTPAQPDGDCGPVHSNVQNFGGQEYIPLKNPVGLRNGYY